MYCFNNYKCFLLVPKISFHVRVQSAKSLQLGVKGLVTANFKVQNIKKTFETSDLVFTGTHMQAETPNPDHICALICAFLDAAACILYATALSQIAFCTFFFYKLPFDLHLDSLGKSLLHLFFSVLIV